MRRSLLALAILLPLPAQAVPLERVLVVSNEESRDLALIDPTDKAVKRRIDLPFAAWQLAVSKETGLIIASDFDSGGLMLFDATTGDERARFELSARAEHMQLAPGGTRLAVVDSPNNAVGFLSLEEPFDFVVNNTLDAPHNVIFTPGGDRLLAANLTADIVSILDTATAETVAEIALDGEAPFGGITDVSLLGNGRFAVAASADKALVALIDLETSTADRIELPFQPLHGFPAANGQFSLITDAGGGVSRLRVDGRIERLLELPVVPTSVHPMLFDSLAVVVAAGHDQIGLIDLDTGQSQGPIELPAPVERGIVSSEGSRLYLTVPSEDRVIVFDAVSRQIVGSIDGIGDYPLQMAMTGSLNYCY